MRFFVGTSGYSYPEWKGSFYPEKIKAADMLEFYAARFGTVEINATFYRMPAVATVEAWAARVPAEFRFVLKASKRITHDRRLQDVGDPLSYFLNAAMALGDRRGPLLFQLPPNFKQDLGRLSDFLALLPATARVAMEFRHASWFEDPVLEALRAKQVALCIADTADGVDAPFVATAPWGYLRLRDVDYPDAALAGFIDRARAQSWSEAYVFFKHEEEGRGPQFAQRFVELSGSAGDLARARCRPSE